MHHWFSWASGSSSCRKDFFLIFYGKSIVVHFNKFEEFHGSLQFFVEHIDSSSAHRFRYQNPSFFKSSKLFLNRTQCDFVIPSNGRRVNFMIMHEVKHNFHSHFRAKNFIQHVNSLRDSIDVSQPLKEVL